MLSSFYLWSTCSFLFTKRTGRTNLDKLREFTCQPSLSKEIMIEKRRFLGLIFLYLRDKKAFSVLHFLMLNPSMK